MNAKQTKMIEQAATVETDGEGWRRRMEEWLDSVPKCGLTLAKLIAASKLMDSANVPRLGRRMWYKGFEYIA